MTETLEWPWITVTDNEQFEGVVWKIDGEMKLEDAPDNSGDGILVYDVIVHPDHESEDFDWESFNQYTGSWVIKVVENSISSFEDLKD